MCDTNLVYDPQTGLTWQRNLPLLYGVCRGRYFGDRSPTGDACTWNEAGAYCAQLTLDGTGWRLPTKDELLSIVDMTVSAPAIDVAAFPGTPPEIFWSSSRVADSTGYAWSVQFKTGNAVNSQIAFTFRVRCVR